MITLELIFGTLVALFLPGFAWSFVFFEKRKLGALERIAISFGLSVVIVSLTVLLLNYIFNMAITLPNVLVIIAVLVSSAAAAAIVRGKSRGVKQRSPEEKI